METFAVAKLSKEMHEYNRAHPELTEPLVPYTSEANADAVIKQGEKKFGEAQQDLVRFSKILLAMEHDSGLITDEIFSRLLKSWKHYVPMAQVFDENGLYAYALDGRQPRLCGRKYVPRLARRLHSQRPTRQKRFRDR